MVTASRIDLVSLDQIEAAARLIRGVALRTPLLGWEPGVWLKPESLQPVGSFKIRGAYARLAALTPDERRRGVVTYSSGNHALAVARAARLLGVRAVIVMPEDAPGVKVRGVERDGAQIVRSRPGSDERQLIAMQLAERERLVVIPPYDDQLVIAGQGTCGLEIAEDLPDVTSVVVPVGGGGLISGIAAAVKAMAPRAHVIGVEPADAADATESLSRGEIVRWPAERTNLTIADGLRVQALAPRTFVHMRLYVDEMVIVSDDELRDAVRALAYGARLVVEPSGAAAMAAHLAGRIKSRPRDSARAIVVSGGNVDAGRYLDILAS